MSGSQSVGDALVEGGEVAIVGDDNLAAAFLFVEGKLRGFAAEEFIRVPAAGFHAGLAVCEGGIDEPDHIALFVAAGFEEERRVDDDAGFAFAASVGDDLLAVGTDDGVDE